MKIPGPQKHPGQTAGPLRGFCSWASCADVERLRCHYIPEKKCIKETKQFCHQVEQLVVEKTCKT